MALKTIGAYVFPSRSRQELYGEDQMVHVWWRDNPWLCSAVTQRAPRSMTFGDFWSQLIVPWAGTDPELAEGKDWSDFEWTLGGEPFAPDPQKSLADLGIAHKATLSMRGAAA